jgi:phosphomannomutase/phosphoglucomutase
MVDHIFREYDIRGKVGSELITEQMYLLTQAIAAFFIRKNPAIKTVAVGMDGRLHSPTLKHEAVRALQDSGLNVVFLGICPTPTLYFSQFAMQVDAGIMITASHNPAEYNGLKIVFNRESVWGKDLMTIRELYKQGVEHIPTRIGTYHEVDGVDQYVDYLVQAFSHLHGLTNSAIIDCANAVGGVAFPRLIKKLNWKNVHLLYPELDGTYPNHEADPVVEKNMHAVRERLKQDNYEFGIGLDGDCDRMAAMTKSGYLIPGDQLLGVFSKEILRDHPGAAIVFDVKASQGLIDQLTQWGARPCISACGHSIIKNEMKKTGALLGGELSCHFCFKDRYFGYDDGIYAALRLFELLHLSKKSLDELIAPFPKKYSSPEIRMNCSEDQKNGIVQGVKEFFAERSDATLLTIDGVRVTLPYGWGLVRASNTQAVLSLRFEADSPEQLVAIKKEFITALKPFYASEYLEHYFFGM